MWITILVVVGSVLLVVSGFAWTARRDAVEVARRIGALRVAPIAEVDVGRLAAVKGTVRVSEPITDPVTEEKVAFYEARVTRTDGGETTLHEESRGRSIQLDDGSGTARVELVGTEIDLPMEAVERTDERPSATMRALLEAGEVEVPSEAPAARYVLSHRALRAGDALTVVGVARDEAGTLTFSPAAGLLHVTAGSLSALQEREQVDVRSMSRMLAVAAAVGVVLLAVGGWLMLAHG
jgi:hypothetical protein